MTKCLDAETIAAWMDGSLTDAERASAEAHAADCDRCLAVLASVAKTAPPAQQAVRRSGLPVRWLVPVATAAVVVVGWALVQETREALRPVDTVSAPATESTPSAAASAERREVVPQSSAADAVQKKAEPAVVAETRKTRQSAPREGRANAADEAARREQLERLARDGLVAVPPPAAPSAPPPATITAPSPVAAAPRAGAAAPVSAQEFVQRQLRSAVSSTLIVSPDPNVLWRIAAASVERSTDAGRTWTLQATGTQVPLSSGASPAPGVCWMVGRDGTVLLTIDGESWRRIDFPDSTAQLIAVSARDALSATVTTTDGRIYRTADGGKTWTLQEILTAAF